MTEEASQRDQEPGPAAPDAGVSVVVVTRNAARTLRACLTSIRGQSLAPRELIVVDNSSLDGTARIAAEYADQVVTAGPERSAQRNTALEIAGGDWVMWVDADMVLPPDCLMVARETAERRQVDAVAIPEVTIGVGYWTACRALERSCYRDIEHLHNPRFVRRELLLALPFDEDMSGPEDAHLRHALRSRGVAVALAPSVIEHDEGRLTLRSVMSKRVYYGRSLPEFRRKNPGQVSAQARGTLEAFYVHRRELLAKPGTALGIGVMRTAEVVAYTVGAMLGPRGG